MNEGSSQPDPTLEQALAALEVPRARPSFRAALRAEFVGGGIESSATGERFVAALRAVPRPPADDAFRRRLRAEFVQPANRQRGSAGGGGRLMRWLAPVGLAAAALMFIMRPLTADRPEWDVLAFPDRGSVVWDGREIAARELVPADHAWRSLATGEEALRLLWNESVLVEVAPESRVRWHSAAKDGPPLLAAEGGGVHFTARPGSAPVRLFVETEDARVEFSGSSVGIDFYPGKGTCICVLDGEVLVTTRVGETLERRVASGRTCFVHADGREPSMVSIPEHHRRPLEALRQGAAEFSATR